MGNEKDRPAVTMSATNTKGGKAEMTVGKDGQVTQTKSGDQSGIHQTAGDQVIRETD